MPQSRLHTATPESGAAASAWNGALGLTYKALKAFSFYPEDHPLREKILLSAYQALAEVARQGVAPLIVNRNGFSFANQKTALATSPMTKELAHEFFSREIQRVVVLADITQAEFNKFLSLM